MRWGALVFLAVTGCAVAAVEPNEAREDDYSASDFAEDTVLPYSGDWLDAPKALSGIGQFDRLKGTIHDDAKCSTMVAVAAAIVGGKDHFVRFVDSVAKIRAGRRDDLEIVERVRAAVEAKALTPRLIHEFTECAVRAYDVAHGAFDSQISTMIRASGYTTVHVGSKKPQVLVDSLENREVVPLGTIADGEAHITLLWKDARGVVRLYDSDDVGGSHVMPRGSAPYRKRIDDPKSGWDPGDKYR